MVPVPELLDRFPGVPVDRDALPYFTGLARRRLVLLRCPRCEYWVHPPLPICPRCWHDSLDAAEPTGAGMVHALVRLPAPDGEPRTLVVVELDEHPGLRVTASLATDTDATIGSRVVLAWTADSDPYPRFRPVGDAGGRG